MVRIKKRIYKPKSDNEFFEQLSHIVFIIGFNYQIVEKRWPGIKKAFGNFDIGKVSGYGDKDFQRIMKSKAMIKNKRKIRFIMENARICKDIQKEFGSVLKWIAKLKSDRRKDKILAPTLAESFRTFRGIGATTSGWLESVHEAKRNYIEYTVER